MTAQILLSIGRTAAGNSGQRVLKPRWPSTGCTCMKTPDNLCLCCFIMASYGKWKNRQQIHPFHHAPVMQEYLVPPFLSLMSSRQPLPQSPEIEEDEFIDRLILYLYIFSLRNPKCSSACCILSASRNWYCCVLREIREKNMHFHYQLQFCWSSVTGQRHSA